MIKIAILSLPVLIVLISINIYVDPANLYTKEKYEKGIVELLCDSFNVTNVYNYDERLLQKHLIQCLHKEPETVILGSSRSMLISSEFISNGLLNNGVSGATIQDYLAIYNLYQKRKFYPKTIILGLEPWQLNDNCEQNRWTSLANEYFEMLDNIGLQKYYQNLNIKIEVFKSKIDKYLQMVSFKYFQQSLSMLGSKTTYYPTKEIVNDNFTKQVDGSIYYDKKYRNIDSLEIIKAANSLIHSKPIYSLGNFTKLSDTNIEILEKFVQYLNKQNVEIIFFLAPYHPIVYDCFKTNDDLKIVLETEKFYIDLAKKYNIKLIGSFNPNTYRLKNIDFFDGIHCKNNAIKVIFSENNNKKKN